jgi:hypothetical protein
MEQELKKSRGRDIHLSDFTKLAHILSKEAKKAKYLIACEH